MKQIYVGTSEAGKYQLNKDGAIKILMVIGWSCLSAFIASLIAVVPDINVPLEWIWLVPVINSTLVALKKFIDSK